MAKKKTNEEFIKEVYDLVGDEYTFLEEYKGNAVKIKVRHNCKKCDNNEWEVSPTAFFSDNTRCPQCRSNRTKTHEEFVKEVYELVGDEYEVLGKYINKRTKVLIKHKCNHEYEINPQSFLYGENRCNKCRVIKKPKRLTTKEFKQEVYNLYGDDYSIMEEFKSKQTNILIKHNLCKHEWKIRPSHFLNGHCCPNCNGGTKKDFETFKEEVKKLEGDNYTILGDYVNARTKIKMRHNCKDCNNHEYEVVPDKFLQGRRCPECFGTQLKTQKEFEEEIRQLYDDKYIVIGKYINNNTHIRIKHNCEKCNYHEWDILPSNLLKGRGCPKCKESNGEKLIDIYLKRNKIEFKEQLKFDDCRSIYPLPFDFAIFKGDELIGVIEFDGQQHFEAFEVFGGEVALEENHKRDEIKNSYCEKNNIPFLRIKYIQVDILDEILNNFVKNPKKYTKNHFYKMTKEEYYKELKDNFT